MRMSFSSVSIKSARLVFVRLNGGGPRGPLTLRQSLERNAGIDVTELDGNLSRFHIGDYIEMFLRRLR